MDDIFKNYWDHQVKYNQAIREANPVQEELTTYWAKQYLLGLVSEVDEVLREINWKKHRVSNKIVNRSNLALELADLSKYVFSLWELFGFSPLETLSWIRHKSLMLEEQQKLEHFHPSPGQTVLVTDIDGTLADWRASFSKWLVENGPTQFPEGARPAQDPEATLMYDQDLGWSYPAYVQLKKQFEESGGYATLEGYTDAILAVRWFQSQGAFIAVFTARPVEEHKNIWWDTFNWLEVCGIYPHNLFIEGDARVIYAASLKEKGHPVVMMEDNPDLMLRAASAGIDVYSVGKVYNQNVQHPKVHRVSSYLQMIQDYKGLVQEQEGAQE